MPSNRLARRIKTFARITSVFVLVVSGVATADEPPAPAWNYSAELMRPFWKGPVMEGESVLFIKDAGDGEARASVLFPIRKVLAVRDSAGAVTYEEGRDYLWKPGSREIVLPPGSRIVASTPAELRRPPKSQMFELTHRDGNGEIFFGAKLEYHALQTCITYAHDEGQWTAPVPMFDPKALPRTVKKLAGREPVSIVVLGDSISTGCNASGWAGAAPFQPGYPELVRRQLQERYQGEVNLTNLSVGGMDTGWALTMIDKVVEPHPDLVVVAFGMNDSAGRSAADYRANTEAVVARVRERLPDAEFILVATMLGNPAWTRLRHEAFAEYRDALATLQGPGVALADLTSIWARFLELKQDWDQTGNGVNHPNDFGHRVYAQVITSLLTPDEAKRSE
ncbi:SGNH/GDSL hydrolase family protein [Planctomyces sp. SH-PL62]|uniref:SGNH/GDSL hydrolase family protein n=1 Tax=Planctomyces sp. SH-PL62 TaxID=1636152 RepID=UPI00078C64B4|nr:SGNH/GDSL hydrolase family protein [Planctomyces sp. SH-PL62]AMV38792.1 GDSL-like Lipase/Acylhydrolase [Planctomyces sp. SH-PL62]